MSLKIAIISGLKWTAGARLGGQVITWAMTIVVMRLLTPSDYGLQAMASVFVAFLLMMAEIGLGPALIQKNEISREKLRQAFGIVLTVNVTLLLLLNALAPVVAAFFDDERLELILRVLSLQFPIIAFSIIPDVLLQRRLQFKRRSLIDFTAAIASSVFTLCLAWAQFGVWSLVLGSLFFVTWKTVTVNAVSPFLHWPSFSLRGMKELLFFGGNVTLASVLWFLFNQADILIIGKLLGKELLGIYSVAMHLASLPVQRVSSLLNQVAFPAFSRYQQDPVMLGTHALKAISILSFFSFPVLWGISSTASEIVAVFLGTRWQEASLPLQLLALIMPLRMIANFLPSITDALGRPEIGLRNVALACLVMPLAFYFGSRWGIAGVAITWVSVYPIVLLVNIRRSAAAIEMRLTDLVRAVAPPAVAAAGMYAAVAAVRHWIGTGTNHADALVVMVLIGIVTYAGLTLTLNRQGYRQLKKIVFQD